MIWQLHAENEWRLGEMVRGVVRQPYLAEVYYDEDRSPSWVWFARVPGRDDFVRGLENTFSAAVDAAEAALGTRLVEG